MNDLLVNVCYGTTKSAEIVSRDMRVSTGQHADCAGGGGNSPLYTGLYVREEFFNGGLFSIQPGQR